MSDTKNDGVAKVAHECDTLEKSGKTVIDTEKSTRYSDSRELVRIRGCKKCIRFFNCKILGHLEKNG